MEVEMVSFLFSLWGYKVIFSNNDMMNFEVVELGGGSLEFGGYNGFDSGDCRGDGFVYSGSNRGYSSGG